MGKVSIKDMTPDEKTRLFEELQADRKTTANQRREGYEILRKDMITQIMDKVEPMADEVKKLFDFVGAETKAFHSIMSEYGQFSREGQMNYKITDGDNRVEVKTNKIKKFDERAELAAGRLIEFLKGWVKSSAKGTDDPMYQLAMSMLSRNQNGDLDYKYISKLYDMESKFNSTEYSEIMTLFKESNRVEGTATNFYFYKKDSLGVFRKLEISFNRL